MLGSATARARLHIARSYRRDVVLGPPVGFAPPQCLPKLSRPILEERQSSLGAEGVRLAQYTHEILRTNGGDGPNAAVWAYV